MAQAHPIDGATVVAFPKTRLKLNRPAPRAGERFGAVLVFTGVRYERTIADTMVPRVASHQGIPSGLGDER